MPNRIPVSVAKQVAVDCDCEQIILLAWDGQRTHIVTYGKTIEACAMAAEGGNMLKRQWGWPEKLISEPSSVVKLRDEIKKLKAKLAES